MSADEEARQAIRKQLDRFERTARETLAEYGYSLEYRDGFCLIGKPGSADAEVDVVSLARSEDNKRLAVECNIAQLIPQLRNEIDPPGNRVDPVGLGDRAPSAQPSWRFAWAFALCLQLSPDDQAEGYLRRWSQKKIAGKHRCRKDGLQKLIDSIVKRQPDITWRGVLDELRLLVEQDSIPGQADIHSVGDDDEGEIEWSDEKGVVRYTKISGLKDRVSRAKKPPRKKSQGKNSR